MEKIKLLLLEDSDLDIFKEWLKQDFIAKLYDHPNQLIKEVQDRNKDDSFIHYFMVMYENKKIGFCQYYELNRKIVNWRGNIPLSGTYSIDYFIGEKEYLNQYFSLKIIEELEGKLLLEENVERIIICPKDEKFLSCRSLMSYGFFYDFHIRCYVYLL